MKWNITAPGASESRVVNLSRDTAHRALAADGDFGGSTLTLEVKLPVSTWAPVAGVSLTAPGYVSLSNLADPPPGGEWRIVATGGAPDVTVEVQ